MTVGSFRPVNSLSLETAKAILTNGIKTTLKMIKILVININEFLTLVIFSQAIYLSILFVLGRVIFIAIYVQPNGRTG